MMFNVEKDLGMRTPQVSVIIPCYNRAYIIRRAINSVLHQTFQDFEIIVVDDGSTDNTEEIIREFQENDRRIRYFCHDKNKGGSSARNTGIKLAKGQYIAFLDSDDEWLPSHLHRKVELIKEMGVDGLIGSFYTVVNSKYSLRKCLPKPFSMSIIEYIFLGLGDTRSSTMVFIKKALEQVLFDEKLFKQQDWDLAIRFSNHFKIGVDSAATVNIYVELPDRMGSKGVNQQAVRRLFEKYGAMVSRKAKQRFTLIVAIKTFLKEGKTENFDFWVEKGLQLSSGITLYRLLFIGFSIPFFDKVLINFLKGYFKIRRWQTRKRVVSESVPG